MSELFVEFAPYNGATHIVMGDEEGIELVPRDSAMGRALCRAAYVPTPREINESDFAPPPAEVVDIHKHQ
ncbi:hypothetical protein [Halomonas sp. I5-271120]|uniref:hypothetical protein n=1 Tax=Halomonas sp. I5-271120 TaxID=3061632 RepID=UPI002714DBB6|nr:hypothetical protein [Halomonas sp. I5-271120]